MSIFIPVWVLWLPGVYLVIGVLLMPYYLVRVHKALSGNHGWTWKRTLFGDRGRRNKVWWPISIILGWAAIVILWPWAVREL
jgi:hypothetical protein